MIYLNKIFFKIYIYIKNIWYKVLNKWKVKYNMYLLEIEVILQWRYFVLLLYKKGENFLKYCIFDVN